ncbi:MAG: ATP-binding protein, partial [Planctomycetota bacterium]
AQFRKGIITDGERYNKVVDIWTGATDKIAKEVFAKLAHNEGKNEVNPVYIMMDSGARGNKQQVRQLCGTRGLMAKPSGEIIERPILSSFREGLTVLEYFISTLGARKGLADTALKTADAGYLTRKLCDVAMDVIICEDDSGARDGVWNGEICNRAKDGRLYWMRTTVAAFRDPQGTIERYVAIRTEITEEKLKEEKLQEARRAADAANQAKTEFLSNMSHEIRTPLTAILGYVELLEDDNMASVPERRKEVLETIRSAGSHLLTIVNDILDLSKIDAGQLLVEHIETDIANLLRSIESLMRPRAAEKQLKFEVKFDTPIPTRAVTDPTRLRQILMNLLSNAIKFTAAGSVTLRLSVESEDAECVLRLAVEDTGMGITAEQARQLFSAFKQADATVTRRHGGTGLGLVICQRLAQLMGGHVELTASEPGKGSLFTAMIPMGLIAGAGCTSQLSAFTDSPSQVSSRTTVRLSGRILLAEDLPVNQRLISFHLTKAGAEVDVAEHGGVALLMIEKARANGNPYDLLLTDIQMPEMDGYALARTLRKRGCDIPIVALTAHVMLDDLQKCMEAGCTDYASKPIDKAVLLEKCSQWLDGRGTEAVGDGRQSLGHHSALIEMVPVSAD